MKIKEKLWEIIFLVAAGFSILAVLLICLFLFANGIPAMHKIGLTDFCLELNGNRGQTSMVFSQ